MTADTIPVERGVLAEAYTCLDQTIDYLLDVSQDSVDYGSDEAAKVLEMLHMLQRSRAALSEAIEAAPEAAE